MQGENEFLEAIQEDPGNHDIRLIYADWLEEQGDPRGELIRCCIEAAQHDVTFQKMDLWNRILTLAVSTYSFRSDDTWPFRVLEANFTHSMPEIRHFIDIDSILFCEFITAEILLVRKSDPWLYRFNAVQRESGLEIQTIHMEALSRLDAVF